jgi:hypothetical protein
MDKVHDLGHERLLGTLSMAWCIPLLLEGTTCGHWVMATLEEAHPNLVLLVRMSCTTIILSVLTPRLVSCPSDSRSPNHKSRPPSIPRAQAASAQNGSAHSQIPSTASEPSRLPARIVAAFASTPSTSEVETCISRPRNQALLRP